MVRARKATNTAVIYDPPAMNVEDRYDQLIAQALDLAEERIRDKSASNQLIAEIMRYGTTKERLQKEKLRRENEVLRVKAEAMEAQKQSGEMYEEAIRAMKSYTGYSDSDDEEFDEYED